MTAQLDEIKKAHHALMVEYVNILKRVSKLFVDFEVACPLKKDVSFYKTQLFKWLKHITLAFLVRLFVESHIKGKIKELNVSYVQHGLVVDEDSISSYQDWRKQTEEASAQFTDTLSTWQVLLRIGNSLWLMVSGFVLSIIPFATLIAVVYLALTNFSGIVTGLFKISSNQLTHFNVSGYYYVLYQSNQVLFADLANISIVVAYFLFCICVAFAYKRSLFLPGSGFLWFDHALLERPETVKNVYEMEDDLFDLLGKGKNREFPIDLATFALFLLIFGLFLLLIPFFPKFNSISESNSIDILILVGISICWILGFVKLWKIRHRWC